MSGTNRGQRLALNHLNQVLDAGLRAQLGEQRLALNHLNQVLDAGLRAQLDGVKEALDAARISEAFPGGLGQLAQTLAELTRPMPRIGLGQVPGLPQIRGSALEAMIANFPDAERLSQRILGDRSAVARHQLQQSSDAVMASLRSDNVQWPVLDSVFQRQVVFQSLQQVTRLWDQGWLKELRRVHRIPPNWVDVDDELLDELNRMQEALMSGVPLAVVPRGSTVEAVMRRATPGAQRAVLWSRRVSVLTDCRVVLNRIEPEPDQLVWLLAEAIAAAEDGHWAAAQALAANVIDSALSHRGHQVIHPEVQKLLVTAGKAPPRADELVSLWIAPLRWVALMLVPAYTSTFDEAAPVGRRFNRHAAAHLGGRAGVYSKVNGLCAVMLATASLWLLDFLGAESPLEGVSQQVA